jgi:hypothetical protein
MDPNLFYLDFEISCAFTQRIDNFEGDNDNVEEELESSAEKRSNSISPDKR